MPSADRPTQLTNPYASRPDPDDDAAALARVAGRALVIGTIGVGAATAFAGTGLAEEDWSADPSLSMSSDSWSSPSIPEMVYDPPPDSTVSFSSAAELPDGGESGSESWTSKSESAVDTSTASTGGASDDAPAQLSQTEAAAASDPAGGGDEADHVQNVSSSGQNPSPLPYTEQVASGSASGGSGAAVEIPAGGAIFSSIDRTSTPPSSDVRNDADQVGGGTDEVGVTGLSGSVTCPGAGGCDIFPAPLDMPAALYEPLRTPGDPARDVQDQFLQAPVREVPVPGGPDQPSEGPVPEGPDTVPQGRLDPVLPVEPPSRRSESPADKPVSGHAYASPEFGADTTGTQEPATGLDQPVAGYDGSGTLIAKIEPLPRRDNPITPGEHSERVRQLQRTLNNINYSWSSKAERLDENGIFNIDTGAEVRGFKYRHYLDGDDSDVGPTTAKKLNDVESAVEAKDKLHGLKRTLEPLKPAINFIRDLYTPPRELPPPLPSNVGPDGPDDRPGGPRDFRRGHY